MTAVCSGGASAAKAGVAASVVVDAAYIQSILPTGLAWAYPYLPYMHGLQIGDVGAFCTVDPPSFTVPSALDILDFLTGGPIGTYNTVNEFLQNVTKAYLWYRLCECTSMTTPAAPAAPTAPTGLPAVNPPILVAPTADAPACYDQSIQTPIDSGGPYEYSAWLWHGTPSNLSLIRLTIHQPQIFTTASPPVSWTIYQTTNGSVSVIETRVLPPNFDHVIDIPVRPLATELRVTGTAPYTKSDKTTIRIQGFCGPAAPVGGSSSGCCPPDPAVMAMLSRLDATVTLIQRQSVPFAYVPGTSHTGLSGAGSIEVSGLIGVRWSITELAPSLVGVEYGEPEPIYGLGWFNWGTDGYEPRQFLTAEETLSLPPNAGAYTSVAYSLAPGVVATLQELLREP